MAFTPLPEQVFLQQLKQRLYGFLYIESKTGFIHFPVCDLLPPLAQATGRMDKQLLVSQLKDTGKVLKWQ